MTAAGPDGFDVKEVRVSRGSASTRRTGGHAAIRILSAAALLLSAWALVDPALAQSVKGEVSATVDNGFTRLAFTLAEDVEPQVNAANGIIIISFKRPVEIALDRLAASAGGTISAVRRDPDGRAIRIALARKVTVNAMPAVERLFVDLLPQTWTGLPPGLPREVIEELSRRAREADKKLLQQRLLVRQSKMMPIRVRVAAQPLFTRYVFELPELIGVAANNAKDKLTLTFDALLKFDLADAQATLPAVVGAIDSEIDHDTVVVRFTFAGKVDVRTFREDTSFIVDVTPMEKKSERREGAAASDDLSAVAAELAAKANALPVGIEAPATMPARPPPGAAAPAPPPQSMPQPAASGREPVAADSARDAWPPAPVLAVEAGAPPAAKSVPAGAAKEVVAPPSPPFPPPPAAAARPRAADPDGARALVNVAWKRQGDSLSLRFPFASATPAAVFSRADTLWLVFDTDAAVGIGKLEGEPSRTIKAASVTQQDGFAVVRVQLERPRLISAATDGRAWTITFGGEVIEPTRPVAINRNVVGTARSSITIPFDFPQRLHRLEDPEAGDGLLVVTALGPARGFVKVQDFVEFRALVSIHGVVVQPIADDLGAVVAVDKIVVTRPSGLTLSAAANGATSANATYQPHVIDPRAWGFDRQADFKERNTQLIRAAAEAPEATRPIARADLARFYLAREMGAEAKAVLDVTLADNAPSAEDPTPLVLHAVANLMMGRLDAALKDLAHPFVGNQHDAPLWRALIYARQGKWSDAREGFGAVGMAMGALPIEMQRMMLRAKVRASIEIGDITGAVKDMHEFEAVGIPRELEPTLSVLTGRIAEGLGRADDALRAYRAAADSWDRPVAAQGRLRELVLQASRDKLPRSEAIAALETLTTTWRGDETEVEALQLLARLYTEESRYRDAFHVIRTALAAHPNSEMTRRIHDEAAVTFESLFLGGKGDALAAIDALSLFYDFRDLTPIGRRGDEMIRRLADRLVSVDLLDQAAELLQHQVDHRLEGAARAQVATRLAAVYLMNRKADRALAALRATRTAELSNDLRNQRLLLEARALSDLGRHDVALEVVANIAGPETVRLRADVLWAARRWGEAAEQIELLYGDRWQEFAPLAADEWRDILRAGVGYVLGEDSIGIMRLREKYAGKFEDGPERRAFDVITAPVDRSGAGFLEIARGIATVDTLGTFLRDLRARYPDTASSPQAPAATAPAGRTSDPAATGTATPRPLPAKARADPGAASPLPPTPAALPRRPASRSAPGSL